MKKLLSLVIAVIFSIGLSAQTELTEAPDFTATDCLGNEINLYEILEGGKYVLLHITTKSVGEDDAQKVPSLVEAYKKLGCNQHDVFFIEALTNVLVDLAVEHVEEYGIEFPVIHNTESSGMDGPATNIMRQYGFPVTTVLIAPNKTVALEIETIETSDDVITALKDFGIKEYECGGDEETPEDGEDPETPGDGGEDEGEDPETPVDPEEPGDGGEEGEDPETPVDPEEPGDEGEEEGEDPEELTPVVEIEVKNVTPLSVEVAFTPAGECASYYILLDTEESMEGWATAFGVPLEQLIEMWSIERTGASTNLWDELIPNTEYTIFVLSKDIEGENIQLDRQKVTTEVLGGEGVSVIDLQVEVISDSSVYVVVTPNEETAEYHYILIEKLYADSIGVDSTMKILYADPYALYDIDRWEWSPLSKNTAFYAIAQGKNAKGEWGEITKVEFVTTTEGNIELVEDNFNIYPNPVNDRLYIETQTLTQTIEIYDVYGRRQDLSAISGQQSVINVANLNSGIYFVKVVTENGEVVKRFVKK